MKGVIPMFLPIVFWTSRGGVEKSSGQFQRDTPFSFSAATHVLLTPSPFTFPRFGSRQTGKWWMMTPSDDARFRNRNQWMAGMWNHMRVMSGGCSNVFKISEGFQGTGEGSSIFLLAANRIQFFFDISRFSIHFQSVYILRQLWSAFQFSRGFQATCERMSAMPRRRPERWSQRFGLLDRIGTFPASNGYDVWMGCWTNSIARKNISKNRNMLGQHFFWKG